MKAEKAYDDIAHLYDDNFQSAVDKAEDKLIARGLVDFFVKHWNKDGDIQSVLDVGCGTGYVLDILDRPEGVNYVGVDISENMLTIARHKHPVSRFVHTDIVKLGEFFDDETFDFVVSTWGAFSYSMNPQAAFGAMYDSLKSGGMFHVELFSWRYHMRPTHITDSLPIIGYTSLQLKRMLTDFEDVTVRGMNVCNFAPLMNLSSKTIGRKWPDLCYVLIVEGRKP